MPAQTASQPEANLATGQTAAKPPLVEILWTGGYDSTFRMAQLSKLPVTVRPYYLISIKRDSTELEIAAIKKITDLLRCKTDTRAVIEDVTILPQTPVAEYPADIVAAHQRTNVDNWLGNQYKYLAAFARLHPGLELSAQADGRIDATLHRDGVLVKVDTGILQYYELDKEQSLPDVVTLFGDFRFPILDYTKAAMNKEYRQLGCRDVRDLTWFCHWPIKGKPCGRCHPCRYAIEEGLFWRLPLRSLLRYFRKFKLEKFDPKVSYH